MVTEEQVKNALRHVVDPELGVNIVDLGLVYNVDIGDNHVKVDMSLTTPGCPLHDSIVGAAEVAIWQRVEEVESVQVNLVWNPPWHPTMMSGQAKQALGWN